MIYNKSKEDFTFDLAGTYDIDEIKKEILLLNNEWYIDTTRQKSFQAHSHTKSYILNKVDIEWASENDFKPESFFSNKKLDSLCLEIVKDLEKRFDGKAGQVLFINLPSTKEIYPHIDKGEYLEKACRFHIPIFTNRFVSFKINNEVKKMAEGECWEINNMKAHSVENFGKTDRIHLLIDIMPNVYINKNLL
jgi:hypothetical protein